MKCRYCLRALRVVPHTPLEIQPHCSARGCTWCVECHAGQTMVSPLWIGRGPDNGSGGNRFAA